MPTIRNDYPAGLSEEDIQKQIQEFTNEIIIHGGTTNVSLQFVPLIQLGQSELNSRHTQRVTRLTTRVSYISLLIASAALAIAMYGSSSSLEWEEKQLGVLNEIEQELSQDLEVVIKSTPLDVVDSSGNIVPPSTMQNKSHQVKNSNQQNSGIGITIKSESMKVLEPPIQDNPLDKPND